MRTINKAHDAAGKSAFNAAKADLRLIDIYSDETLDHFAELSGDEREGFFDALLKYLDAAPGNWARFYKAVQLLRENDWYWREKGFESFESFWQTNAEYIFGSLDVLENTYHFAKLANPEFFDIDYDKAKALQQESARMNAHSVARKVGRQSKRATALLESPEAVDDRLREIGGYQQLGSKSTERRFIKLRSQHPNVAEKFLRGDFVKQTNSGKYVLDLASAEKEAGLVEPEPKKKPAFDPKKAEKAILRALNRASIEEKYKILNRLTSRTQRERTRES